MTMSPDQQTARVNVSDEDWIQFRLLAMRRRLSLAEYLGELVRGELAGPPPPPERREAAPDGKASATRRPARSVRLSEQRLLTQLPRPEPEPSPWEE
jgi:hypothetical protein